MFYLKINRYRRVMSDYDVEYLIEDQSTVVEVKSFAIAQDPKAHDQWRCQVHYTEPQGFVDGHMTVGETLQLGDKTHEVFVMNPNGKTIARYPWAHDRLREEITS